MECEFCKTTLKSLSSLNYHKKTNKKCLEKQNVISTDKLISCEFCSKIFTSQILKTHLQSCKNKKEHDKDELLKEKDDIIQEKDDIIQEKDDMIGKLLKEKDELLEEKDELLKEKDDIIQELKNKIIKLETENDIYKSEHELIKKLASQPKITNNNKINVVNNFIDNPEKVKQIVNEKLVNDYIMDGQKGVARFAYDSLIKDDEGNINYFCTDPSRKIFKFKNSNGNTEKDVKAKKLTTMLVDAGIKNKSHATAPLLWTKEDGTPDNNKFEIYGPSLNEIIFLDTDNSVFRNELASLISI